MADNQSREHDEQRRSHQLERSAERPEQNHSFQAGETYPVYPPSLLADTSLKGRGNRPVKTAMLQSMQQSNGNRAIRHYVQRVVDASTVEAEEGIARRIEGKAGSGRGIDIAARSRLEAGLGTDLSGVQVHTDAEADRLSHSVGAIAFTTGQDIFFREGAYNPGSDEGLRLLAHEATHTVQQSAGPVDGTPSAGGVSISDPQDSFEQAADRAADAVLAASSSAPVGTQASVVGGAPVQRMEIQRDEEEGDEGFPLFHTLMPLLSKGLDVGQKALGLGAPGVGGVMLGPLSIAKGMMEVSDGHTGKGLLTGGIGTLETLGGLGEMGVEGGATGGALESMAALGPVGGVLGSLVAGGEGGDWLAHNTTGGETSADTWGLMDKGLTGLAQGLGIMDQGEGKSALLSGSELIEDHPIAAALTGAATAPLWAPAALAAGAVAGGAGLVSGLGDLAGRGLDWLTE